MKFCAALIVAIFLLLVAGRMLPVADALFASIKIPMTAVPPITPHAMVAIASGLLIYVAFGLTLPEKAH